MKHLSILFMLFVSQSLFSQQVTLRDTANQFDYIIITVPEFKPACEIFKQHKQSMFGFKVLIADTGMIYSEFNSFSNKEDNIREFISYAGTFWRFPQPKYFLLAGDLIKVPNKEYIYTLGTSFTDTANTDHYYSHSTFSSQPDTCKFAIGRIPAKIESDLNNYFNKVINYESDSSFSPWKSRNLFFSEYDSVTFNIFEQITAYLMTSVPNHLSNKYFTENSDSSNYGNKDSLFNFINTHGVLTLWLIGLSDDTQFTRAPLFTIQDLNLINNDSKNFFTFFLGRQRFGRYINDNSIANKLILDEDASIGVIASVGYAFAFEQGELFRTFSQLTLGASNHTIGDALIRTKNSYPDPNIINILVLNLWGDPSLKLKYNSVSENNDSELGIPEGFVLYQNYPNPFNPSTRISFSLSNPGNVKIKIFDILGNEVTILTDGFYDAGFHSIDFNAKSASQDLSSGIYFYTLKAGNHFQSKKMLYLK